MFLDTSSIQVKINGMANYISLGQYLTEAKYGFNKLWGSDSGRNLAGEMSGTLLGIFPKLTLTFRKLNKTELEVITPILDSANQSIKYYDPTKKATVTITTYTGDYEVVNKGRINKGHKNEGFSCSFISTKRRV